jgi:ribosomal protein S6
MFNNDYKHVIRLGNWLFFKKSRRNKFPFCVWTISAKGRNGKEIEELIQLIKIVLNSMIINVNGGKE